jgi:hypothetical protein
MISIHIMFLLLPFAAHIVIAGFMIVRITGTTLFTKKQKRINIILVILVPFVWVVLVYYILKKEPDYFDKRRHISNDAYDNGVGFGGDFSGGHMGDGHH